MRRPLMWWLLSLVLTAVVTSVAAAQINRPRLNPTQPRVVSGDDFGFRVEGTDKSSGKPVGTIVIRVNGEWLEVGGGLKALPATH